MSFTNFYLYTSYFLIHTCYALTSGYGFQTRQSNSFPHILGVVTIGLKFLLLPTMTPAVFLRAQAHVLRSSTWRQTPRGSILKPARRLLSNAPQAYLEPIAAVKGVVAITLDRPKAKNAISIQLLREFRSCIKAAGKDTS